MYSRLFPGLLVVFLVATAGCFGGGPSPPAPDAGAAAGNGDGSGGGTDGGALAENQTAVLLAAGSYTSDWRLTVTEGGEVVGETAYVTAIDTAAERFHFSSTAVSDGVTRTAAESFYGDGRSYQRFGADEETTYMSGEGDFATVAQYGRGPTVGTSSLSDFTREGTETFDGVRVTRYVLDERVSWLGGQAQRGEDVEWTSFSYEVLVDDDGLVRSERWTSEGVDDDGVTHTVEYSYTITGVGSTDVPDPDWLDAARRA